MIGSPVRRRLVGQSLYVGLVLMSLFLRLRPIDPGRVGWPGPDLILCLTLAWVQRRPDYLPAGLVAAVILAEDLFMLRPPGLWAALTVLGAEFLRSRGYDADLGVLLRRVTLRAQ